MRALWLSGNQSLFPNRDTKYNGGGWIGSLESAITKNSDLVLGVAFYSNSKEFKVKIGTTTYYPMNLYPSIITKLARHSNFEIADSKEIDYLLKIVNDFKPDIIHVWGTELCFGLVQEKTNIPVVIHFQGMLAAVFNALLVPGMSKAIYLRKMSSNFAARISKAIYLRYMKYAVRRENRIMGSCHYFLGRTSWDRKIIKLYAPNSDYFQCDEILRSEFYEDGRWKPKPNGRQILISTISDATYKGLDVILKCAKIIKFQSNIDFEWFVYGVESNLSMERFTNIEAEKVSVIFKGIVGSNELKSQLINSAIYVNTSYIDNSPNSLCEAQILGVPVISTNVGGIASLVKDSFSGRLVAANDPSIMAYEIIRLLNNSDEAFYLSQNGYQEAIKRHSPKRIVPELISIYKDIINKNDRL